MIYCGSCDGRHHSSQEVRECYRFKRTAGSYGAGARTNEATEKQVNLVARLAAERQLGELEERAQAVASGELVLDKKDCSSLIDRLMALPKAERTAGRDAAPDLDDGVYLLDGTVYKVVHAVHGSGKQYAKKLVIDGELRHFEYAGRRPLHELTPEHRLTQEDAREFGLAYGICVRCAAWLTREESTFVGYGKTCAGHEGWYYPTARELKELTRVREDT